MIGNTICDLCGLFDWDDEGTPSCQAFPAGIPPEILHRGFDHRNPHPEDGGIRFVPADGVTPEQVEVRLSRQPAGDPTWESSSSSSSSF